MFESASCCPPAPAAALACSSHFLSLAAAEEEKLGTVIGIGELGCVQILSGQQFQLPQRGMTCSTSHSPLSLLYTLPGLLPGLLAQIWWLGALLENVSKLVVRCALMLAVTSIGCCLPCFQTWAPLTLVWACTRMGELRSSPMTRCVLSVQSRCPPHAP